MDIQKTSDNLFLNVSQLIEGSKKRLAIAINTELPTLYWQVGDHINSVILNGARATYGQKIVASLAKKLTLKYGKGWSVQQLRHCLRIAETFTEEQIVYALRRQLSWTHLRTISYENDATKRLFYFEMAAEFRWNTHELNANPKLIIELVSQIC